MCLPVASRAITELLEHGFASVLFNQLFKIEAEMIKPEFPANEAEKLHALKTLQILDTSHEERFDRVTRMGFVAQSRLPGLVASWHDRTQGRQDALQDHQLGRV
jgi:hypothetical protein